MKKEMKKTMSRKVELIIRRVVRRQNSTWNQYSIERELRALGVSGYSYSDLTRIASEETIRASGHIDFALVENEVKCCVVCDEIPHDDRWWDHPRVTLGRLHPIGGLVGICERCGYSVRKKPLLAKWRKTAPPFIRIVAGAPILLVVRGSCDDKALATAIRETFDRVPMPSRKKIMEYVCTDERHSTTGKGLRFEAIGRWPGMSDATGMNMDSGHAIRLRASFVRTSDVQELATVIAHELAHTEQKAEGLHFEIDNECERDVEKRLKSWGFDNGTTEDDERTLRDMFDSIIRLAEKRKATIHSGMFPSGNCAADAIRQAKKAMDAVIRASECWKGK
ncbi:MAG: hypothetical protein ACYC0X_12250 [Pirellulaceae bacterium]